MTPAGSGPAGSALAARLSPDAGDVARHAAPLLAAALHRGRGRPARLRRQHQAAREAWSTAAFSADGARTRVALMRHLGLDSFHLVGHDRGARTAHRMALDTPDRSITDLDGHHPHAQLLNDLNQAVARAYYHWFFLAQPAPFPETLIGHDPEATTRRPEGWGGAR